MERSEGRGPLVVLVHGAMDRSSSFGRVARRLGEHDVLRYDRRGYGRSEPGRAVDLAGHVDDLLALIDGRPAVVLGHSFGGTVALAAASRPATSLLALVVYESPIAAAGPVEPFPHGDDEEPAAVAERFLRAMTGDRVWERLPERTQADRRAEGPALLADLRSARDPDGLVVPSSVTIPVRVGVGERSHPRAHDRAAALVDALPSATLTVVPGAGHGVHLTHPTATAELVADVIGAPGTDPGAPGSTP